MPSRILIDFNAGKLEIEGEESFVITIYDSLKEQLLSKLDGASPLSDENQSTLEPVQDTDQSDEQSAARPKGGVRKRSRSGGPSCASRIQDLQAHNFFDELKAGSEVAAKLSERGANYELKQVAASLFDLVKRGKLRRIKREGNWVYQKP